MGRGFGAFHPIPGLIELVISHDELDGATAYAARFVHLMNGQFRAGPRGRACAE